MKDADYSSSFAKTNPHPIQIRLRIQENLYLQKGWSMRHLAEEMGVDYQTILFWNRGTSHPKLLRLLELARILKCPLDELIEKVV